MKQKKLILTLLALLLPAMVTAQLPEDIIWQKDISPKQANGVRFNPDGQTLAHGAGAEVQIRRVSDGELVREYQGHIGEVGDVCYSADGTLLASTAHLSNVIVRNLITDESYELIPSDPNYKTDIYHMSLSISPDNKYLAAQLYNLEIKKVGVIIWDLDTKTEKKVISLKTMYKLKFSPDGRYLAIANVFISENDERRMIDIYDAHTFNLIKMLGDDGTHHTEQIGDIAFSRDGKLLASGGVDGYVKIWDMKELKLINNINLGEYQDIRSISFDSSSQNIIYGGGGGLSTRIIKISDKSIIYDYNDGGLGLNLDVSYVNNYIIGFSTSYVTLYKNRINTTPVVDFDISKIEDTIYPNPVSNAVSINFNQNQSGIVNLKVFTLEGRLTNEINMGLFEPGNNAIQYNCSTLTNGTYIIKLEMPGSVLTFKLVKED